ncbi:hypothetical protein HYY71_05535 [Candidatus Woesearchaeota archaeon]|nr:hypothetical protein [Candidatus Woesearchaeota archaeon]
MLNQCYILNPQELSCSLLSFGAYNCNSPSQQLVEQCMQNSPWHDLIGNGCGQDGVIDCNENDLNYPLEIRCWQPVCALNSFGSVMEGIMSNHNVIGNLPRNFGKHNERLICKKLKELTGSVRGICSNLCLNGCARGQKCISGVCQ